VLFLNVQSVMVNGKDGDDNALPSCARLESNVHPEIDTVTTLWNLYPCLNYIAPPIFKDTLLVKVLDSIEIFNFSYYGI
jgi:hypothetical protein